MARGRGARWASERARMVERQLAARGIEDERVLAAMGEVPRERFVPPESRRLAYADRALSIGSGQTISQPWVVAATCQALEVGPEDRVLDVGSGSGYSTAVLALLAAEVTGIERHRELAERAAATLDELGVGNARILMGDGSKPPEDAQWDAIAVAAAAPAPPASLLEALSPGGRLVCPVAEGQSDMLTLFRRTPGGVESTPIAPCRFVPLIGSGGFPDDRSRGGIE